MTFLLVPALYGALLWLDAHFVAKNHASTRCERVLYRTLLALAVLSAFPTALALQLDHVGASLSGLISTFTR